VEEVFDKLGQFRVMFPDNGLFLQIFEGPVADAGIEVGPEWTFDLQFDPVFPKMDEHILNCILGR